MLGVPTKQLIPLQEETVYLMQMSGLISSNNFALGGPEAGHCAVDLIYNMSRENLFEGDQQYIYGADPLRNNVYKNIFLLLMLMTEEVNEFLNEEKEEIAMLETRDALNKILSDPRYNKKFNHILNDSEPIGEIQDGEKLRGLALFCMTTTNFIHGFIIVDWLAVFRASHTQQWLLAIFSKAGLALV